MQILLYILIGYVVASYLMGAVRFCLQLRRAIRLRNLALWLQSTTQNDLSDLIDINEPIKLIVIVFLGSPIIFTDAAINVLTTLWCKLFNKHSQH